jgi:hypothetical protein
VYDGGPARTREARSTKAGGEGGIRDVGFDDREIAVGRGVHQAGRDASPIVEAQVERAEGCDVFGGQDAHGRPRDGDDRAGADAVDGRAGGVDDDGAVARAERRGRADLGGGRSGSEAEGECESRRESGDRGEDAAAAFHTSSIGRPEAVASADGATCVRLHTPPALSSSCV